MRDNVIYVQARNCLHETSLPMTALSEVKVTQQELVQSFLNDAMLYDTAFCMDSFTGYIFSVLGRHNGVIYRSFAFASLESFELTFHPLNTALIPDDAELSEFPAAEYFACGLDHLIKETEQWEDWDHEERMSFLECAFNQLCPNIPCVNTVWEKAAEEKDAPVPMARVYQFANGSPLTLTPYGAYSEAFGHAHVDWVTDENGEITHRIRPIAQNPGYALIEN